MQGDTQSLQAQVKKLEQAVEHEKQLKTEVSLHKYVSLTLPFG